MSSRRLGLTLGLVLIFGLVYAVQRYLDALDARGPAALEPIAHPHALAIAFSADGKQLVSIDGPTLQRWDLATGAATELSLVGRGLYRNDYRSIALDDRAELCVANAPDAAYALFLPSTQPAWVVQNCWTAAPSRDGRSIAGMSSPLVFIYDARTHALRRQLRLRQNWDELPGWPAVDLAQLITVCGRDCPSEGDTTSDCYWAREWGTSELVGSSKAKLWRGNPRHLTLSSRFDGHRIWDQYLDSKDPVMRSNRSKKYIAVSVSTLRSYRAGPLGIEGRRERVEVVQVYDARDGSTLLRQNEPATHGHAREIIDLAWAPDDALVASLDTDGRIALWDVKHGRFDRFLGRRP
jgi:WD40 repeat protein